MKKKETPHQSATRASYLLVVLVTKERREMRCKELATFAHPAVGRSGHFVLDLPGPKGEVVVSDTPEALLSLVGERPVSAVVLDNRGTSTPHNFSETVAGRTLPGLLAPASGSGALMKRTIFVILPDFSATAQHAFIAGSLQLGGVLVDPPSLRSAIESVFRTVVRPTGGKVALCLAGGGIEGLFYELGVLRALDRYLVGRSVVDFDIFSGISAGAVISACVANGVAPHELTEALKGRPSRIDPITRGMLFDPNVGEIAGRLALAFKDMLRGEWLRTPLDAALRVTPTAFFSGDRLRWHLEKELSKPGLTNDFNKLEKGLFVGATDQDTGTHITFGETGRKDVPISHAVRASCAMTPYYSPEKIGGRYYIDGIFTRTINLDVAVAHGAGLIICVDPLTPVSSERPGYVSRRGGVFNTVQSIKSMIRTRFSEVIDRAEEAYPNVTVIVFSPTPKDLEKMSGTMMRFFYRIETEEMAYASTVERIRNDYPWLASDFGRHGYPLTEPGT